MAKQKTPKATETVVRWAITDNRGDRRWTDAESPKWAAEDWHDLMCLFPVQMQGLYPITVEGDGNVYTYNRARDHSMGPKARTERMLAKQKQRVALEVEPLVAPKI
jgi:hypothetical protein